ncbi:PepSY domain-containing protein [Bradyrhizobium sp. CB82]|uniref:PepSY domain-containing protein n=1 Tax=Bradyrhizobium sp. CB82 TaxID=3039159 RepID=UPI0024B1CEE9|nr:PepSY domain-containing protein [Bradyrhizobium sp. CB82]WFU38292.1 PepSY domain-containing protein [Bradyrhizobium sp. CB82]
MMGAMILLHRWLGIAFCLLFAMWFASGIVMHFVPFPSLGEAERFAGLASLAPAREAIGPSDAVAASGLSDAARVRLIRRSDGPVYVVVGPSRSRAIRTTDGTDAAVTSPEVALAIATDHARRRGFDVARASVVMLAEHDQWSVPNGFDRHRPLFRVGLADADGTELYVSSVTGEIVLDTTRRERGWNLVGSVVHWIYPTVLRRNWSLWDGVVWSLSLLASIAAVLGAALGIVRIRVRKGRMRSPYRHWHALHHVLGLLATTFVVTWIFSGWLSMDHGRLFSRGQLTQAEADVAAAVPDWRTLAAVNWPPIAPSAREVEWFAFNGRSYRRDRVGLDQQILFRAGDVASDDPSAFLSPSDIAGLTERLGTGCGLPSLVHADDDYPASSAVPSGPVYRTRCGDVWFDVDGSNGVVLQRLDRSRRAYRWLYSALHTLDFPILMEHPYVRRASIVGLCALGLLFSLTGIVIGWRRLRMTIGA